MGRMEAMPTSSFAPSPIKPKRRFLYKDDLPGFSIDSNLEQEKMPISKRRPKEEPKVEKFVPVVKEEEVSEEEDEPKRKKRGPSPTKKKEADLPKPKRIIIYKDDLPGFEVLPDSDVEEAEKKKKKGFKVAKTKAAKDDVQEVEKPKPKNPEAASKTDDAPKPKRIIIYKDDLPGFEALPDSDVESEKLPGKKRGGKPGPKQGKKKKQAISAKIIEDDDKDSDSVSVESFSSSSSGPKKKRKVNKTGFPSPKKQKLDRFITKQKPKSSHSEHGSDDEMANSRRSATMKAKNYSELESDTESLLEVSVGGSVKSLSGKKQKSDVTSKSKKK